jgi:hypothetical protein
MNSMSRLLAVAGFSLMMLPMAAAADSGEWFELRDQRNDARVANGAADGSLTNQELDRVENREQHVDNVTDRALADGDLTWRERRKLDRAHDRESRFIYRQKHDRQGN